jgi:hypothetical protein
MRNLQAQTVRGVLGMALAFGLSHLAFGGKTESVSASEYGPAWPFTVTQGELECINNAVIMHTSSGTYNINGKARGRYEGKFKDYRDIAKPYPGLETEPTARMPPPSGLIQRGLRLCN